MSAKPSSKVFVADYMSRLCRSFYVFTSDFVHSFGNFLSLCLSRYYLFLCLGSNDITLIDRENIITYEFKNFKDI